jgi:RHS repeat-associated protein
MLKQRMHVRWNGRHLCSGLGRFAQADSITPLETQGVLAWDRYAYVNNNPVRFTDPSGHCIFGVDIVICLALAGAAIGAAVGYGAQVYDNYQNGYTGSYA